MQIKDLYANQLIKVGLTGENKFQIIEELIELLDKAEMIKDSQIALDDVIEREQYLSTGLENGIAIPHAKTDTVDELRLAFGLTKNGIDFDSLDGLPVNLVFLVLSPKDTSGPHIQLLAKISRNLKRVEIRESLVKCNSPEEIHKVFEDFS